MSLLRMIGGTTGTPFDITDYIYANKSATITTQDASPVSVSFSQNGTSMYVVGFTNDTIYQYTLSTAWDVSTATYASKSKSVSAQDAMPYGTTFKIDGTSMYVVGLTNDTIYQYTLSTAWDVSTATYASKSALVSAQDSAPYDVSFNINGTSMYVLGSTTDTVYQYTLSTAWDVSTATYASKSKSVSAQSLNLNSFTFNDDGTSMYLFATTIYQYTLSTAWDVSTATYASKSKSVSAEDTATLGGVFGDGGAYMYTSGDTNNKIYQYKLIGA